MGSPGPAPPAGGAGSLLLSLVLDMENTTDSSVSELKLRVKSRDMGFVKDSLGRSFEGPVKGSWIDKLEATWLPVLESEADSASISRLKFDDFMCVCTGNQNLKSVYPSCSSLCLYWNPSQAWFYPSVQAEKEVVCILYIHIVVLHWGEK